jgi:hypothetical protein
MLVLMVELGGRHGAALRSEVATALGERALRSALATGVLMQVWRGVVIHAEDALKIRTQAAAAVLAIGEHAVLSGRTALELHGLTAAVSTDIHITVPFSKCPKSRPGLVIHQSRFDPDDVVELDGLRVLSLPQTLADFLCDGDRFAAFACVDEALHGLSPRDDLALRTAIRERLHARADRRGFNTAKTLLHLATGKADSPPESIFRLRVVEAGFPVPQAQHEIFTIDGQVLYILDIAWPEVRIALEYDGYASHEGREDRDAERDSRMAGRGWITIRADAADLRDPSRVIGELRAAFRKRSG